MIGGFIQETQPKVNGFIVLTFILLDAKSREHILHQNNPALDSTLPLFDTKREIIHPKSLRSCSQPHIF